MLCECKCKEHIQRCEVEVIDNCNFQEHFCWLKLPFEYYHPPGVTNIFPICNSCDAADFELYHLVKSIDIHQLREGLRRPFEVPVCYICKTKVYHTINSTNCKKCTNDQSRCNKRATLQSKRCYRKRKREHQSKVQKTQQLDL
ncbi:hypothetical protein QE152_g33636 [Popillia japonica]|uniref:Uncharacterized protein n=1 Tax=Popillia japonica TaxID=7064 RepID=A0AAW1IW48_POPJA